MRFAFRSSVLAVPLCAALAVSAAACSSSKPAASSHPGLKGKPVRITLITDGSGVNALPGITDAAKARASYINAHGGIAGRPLDLVTCDTTSSPNVAQACARTAANDGSVAVVGMTTVSDSLVTPILAQAELANIGLTPASPVAGDSKDAFCFNPGVAGDFLASPAGLAAEGATKVNIIYENDIGPLSALIKGSFLAGAKQANLQTGTPAGYSNGTTQWDAPIAKATQGGVDGIFASASGSGEVTLIKAIKQQHPNMTVATISLDITPEDLTALGETGNGTVVIALAQPATATSVPGIQKFNADMDAYAKSAARTDLAINAWASVWAFEQVASKLPTIDRASVLAAMSQVKGLDLGGIFPTLSASSMSTKLSGLGCAMNTQVVFEKVSDGKLVALEAGKFYNPFGS